MKRSILSVLAGATFIFMSDRLLPAFLWQYIYSVSDSTMILIIVVFIGGVISGYLSKKNGYLHGLVAGSLQLLIILVFILIFGLYLKFVIQAQWSGDAVDVIKELSNSFKTTILSGLIGSSGGFVGEKIRKKTN
jgi:hypothetical protein